MNPTTLQIIATVLFGLAILHTFAVKRFEHLALKYPPGSVGENLFHLLGEVEVVFGLWAGIFVLVTVLLEGAETAIGYVENLNFTEPAFVFVIMTVAATRPIISAARRLIEAMARLLPLKDDHAFYIVALTAGPLLGSFITEPAAMTVSALLLRDRFYKRNISERLKYVTLAILFVNISIGGTLTHFAAPPVLMVAAKWDWGISHMLGYFGWKAAVAVLINTLFVAAFFRKELSNLIDLGNLEATGENPTLRRNPPLWLIGVHLAFLALVVATAHHTVIFMGLFLFFLGVTAATSEYQDRLALREALLVGFFLGGLVTLGFPQDWWLSPLLRGMDEVPLFLGAAGLTAITDNAALTYLGSQVEGLSDTLKFSLVAGAVAGGGLTVIANAPNPAGFGILRSSFGAEGISPVGLLIHAIPPTLVAMACFWFLPSF